MKYYLISYLLLITTIAKGQSVKESYFEFKAGYMPTIGIKYRSGEKVLPGSIPCLMMEILILMEILLPAQVWVLLMESTCLLN
ncbi:MAG: hypothetical protein BGO48_17800 [Mucilaginibacter sp. 44-25]|nr:MAG: hypothetical protein BGO48_17800 [Mucilaginibacter sp. 44-25]